MRLSIIFFWYDLIIRDRCHEFYGILPDRKTRCVVRTRFMRKRYKRVTEGSTGSIGSIVRNLQVLQNHSSSSSSSKTSSSSSEDSEFYISSKMPHHVYADSNELETISNVLVNQKLCYGPSWIEICSPDLQQININIYEVFNIEVIKKPDMGMEFDIFSVLTIGYLSPDGQLYVKDQVYDSSASSSLVLLPPDILIVSSDRHTASLDTMKDRLGINPANRYVSKTNSTVLLCDYLQLMSEMGQNMGSALSERDFITLDSPNLLASVIESHFVHVLFKISQDCGGLFANVLPGFGSRGRLERSEMIIRHRLSAHGIIIDENDLFFDQNQHDRRRKISKGGNYDGGHVYLHPSEGMGLKENATYVFDYTSMYPSIIREFKIGFTESIPILPEIMHSLMERRSAIKKMMNNNLQDPQDSKNYHIRQLALKLIANSMYGSFGNPSFMFYCVSIAKRIAQIGTVLLKDSLSQVGVISQGSASAFYGDTDSMMVIFQNDTYADKNNKIASDIVSYVAKRHRVVRIVHENTFRSMIMVSKRRYVALTAVGDQLIEKGVESVRRDYCLFARNLYREIARMILSQKQISESLANEEWLCRLCTIVKNKIMQLKDMNQVDVVSKHLRIFKMMNQQILSETKGDQRQKPYHIQAAMGKPGNVPIMTGELIPYVVLTQGRAIYGSVQSISEINWEYYIQVQFLDPLYRLLLAAQVNIDFVKGQFAEIYPVKSTAKSLVSNAILRSQEISYSGSNPADFYLTYHLMPKWKERNPNLALWKQFTCVYFSNPLHVIVDIEAPNFRLPRDSLPESAKKSRKWAMSIITREINAVQKDDEISLLDHHDDDDNRDENEDRIRDLIVKNARKLRVPNLIILFMWMAVLNRSINESEFKELFIATETLINEHNMTKVKLASLFTT